MSKAIIHICVSDSVCPACPHDKTKTAESTITTLGIWIVRHDTSPTSEY